MNKRYKRFSLILMMTFLLVYLLSAGFNYLVDPYGLFGITRLTGFNDLKPAASERVRVVKPYMASRVKPKTVIGGNSRPEIGIDPQSVCWMKDEKPIFNMGMPGAGVFMQTRYIQHAVKHGDSNLVLLSLDFLDFLTNSSKTIAEIDWNDLAKPFANRLDLVEDNKPLMNFDKFKDTFNGFFSLATLQDSITTIISQNNKNSTTRREDGFNPGLDYRPIIYNEGQAILFEQKNREVFDRLRSDNLGIFDASGHRSEPFEALKNFLKWTNKVGVHTILFINPYHSDYLISIKLSGKWLLFEDWKKQLASIADKYGVTLWDFNTIDQYSTENPPLLGDKGSELQWYWEPAHYRRELGDLMLSSMLERDCGTTHFHPGFGSKININTLQAHLDMLSLKLQKFMNEHPEIIDRLKK